MPGRERVAEAEQRMREAQRQLEQAKQKGAIEEMQAAIDELEKAKKELEEILRQLREEELERMLAMLEARFRRMLERQTRIYERTLVLAKIPREQLESDGRLRRNHRIASGRLSREESQIVVDADKALQILTEDGTAVAFPEAVVQMRDDMDQVVVRLAQTKTDKITVRIEEDIIKSLQEMIEALKKAQEELEQQQGQSGQQQQGQQADQPLIDMIAELKMIRSLQIRLNNRTTDFHEMIEEGEIPIDEQPEVRTEVRRLGSRQERIEGVTRDLSLGRNR